MKGWIEHRREDGERVGWLRPDGDGFVPVDLLGRELSSAVDWLTGEELLESAGIGYLADRYELDLGDGRRLRVRPTEVSTDRIVVKKDDFGAIDAPQLVYTLPFPIPPSLRPMEGGCPSPGSRR